MNTFIDNTVQVAFDENILPMCKKQRQAKEPR